MTSKNLNSEIILNLSPLNNIGDALKKFGISEDCPNSIIVKIIKDDESNDFDLNEIINGNVVDITDEYIFDQLVDLPKFRKLYKLNDAKLDKDGDVQGQLTRLAIGACILRGC
ncbi:EKC/KEOPS complex subunit [Candida tropicalis]